MKCDVFDCPREAMRFTFIECNDMPVDLETNYCEACHVIRFGDYPLIKAYDALAGKEEG